MPPTPEDVETVTDGPYVVRVGRGKLPCAVAFIKTGLAAELDEDDSGPIIPPLLLFGASFVQSGFNWPRRPEAFNARPIED